MRGDKAAFQRTANGIARLGSVFLFPLNVLIGPFCSRISFPILLFESWKAILVSVLTALTMLHLPKRWRGGEGSHFWTKVQTEVRIHCECEAVVDWQNAAA